MQRQDDVMFSLWKTWLLQVVMKVMELHSTLTKLLILNRNIIETHPFISVGSYSVIFPKQVIISSFPKCCNKQKQAALQQPFLNPFLTSKFVLALPLLAFDALNYFVVKQQSAHCFFFTTSNLSMT